MATLGKLYTTQKPFRERNIDKTNSKASVPESVTDLNPTEQLFGVLRRTYTVIRPESLRLSIFVGVCLFRN